MLQHLDTLIAFAVVMLGVSLLLTVLTQIVSAFLALRGTHLEWGIKTLLSEAAPALRAQADEITQRVLHHPLISDSSASKRRVGRWAWMHWLPPRWNLFHRWKLANAIRRDELIDLLHHLADAPAAQPGQPVPEWQAALQNANLTQVKFQIEQWFDTTMDRVSQRFAMHSRVFTVVLAGGVAFALHLDAFDLLHRLSTDGELRRNLLEQAGAISTIATNLSARAGTNSPTGLISAEAPAKLSNQIAELKQLATTLSNRFERAGLQLLPDSARHSRLCFMPGAKGFSRKHLFGVLAAAALLSLGAPFWFNTLKTLTNLRPILATKVQKEAEEKKSPK